MCLSVITMVHASQQSTHSPQAAWNATLISPEASFNTRSYLSQLVNRVSSTISTHRLYAFKKTQVYRSGSNVIRHNAPLSRALPCASGALLWSIQMIYFFVYFVTRHAEPDGSWSRIGPSYAVFPFISCVGAVRLACFRAVSISVAILLWTGFAIDYAIGSRSPVGIWWRRGKLFMASTSNAFLIALSFASVDVHHKLHLIFTSLQIICMGLCKACDWNLARAMRGRTSVNRFLERSRYWKRIAAVIALRESDTISFCHVNDPLN